MPPPGHTHPQPSFGVTSSSQSWQSSGPQQVPKNNTLAIVLALLSFTSIIGVAVFVGRQVLMSRTPAVPSASVSVATAAPPPSAVPSATAAVSTTPPDPAVETHDAGIVATATPDASVPIIVRPPPPGPAIAAPPPAPAPGPAPGPAPATKPGCTPPWSYDKQGNKAFKPECL